MDQVWVISVLDQFEFMSFQISGHFPIQVVLDHQHLGCLRSGRNRIYCVERVAACCQASLVVI